MILSITSAITVNEHICPSCPSTMNSCAEPKLFVTTGRFNILASLKIIGHASELDVETNKSATLKYGYGLVLLPKQMTSFSTE